MARVSGRYVILTGLALVAATAAALVLHGYFVGGSDTAGGLHSATKARSAKGYVGSASCRKCHERFYSLWSTSHHGLAMQPYSGAFAKANLSQQSQEIRIGPNGYLAQWDDAGGWIVERTAQGQTRFPLVHVLGGKNVYYFLTTLERGKLQTLPLGYDVRRRQWFDMAGSGMRHFTELTDAAIDWRQWPYTFNTSCYGCHVSQLETNYDVPSDTYRSAWAEPGINCESCHGPAGEHVRACSGLAAGEMPADLKIRTMSRKRGASAQQVNDACASCHSKGAAVTGAFKPGERFFDDYDLVTFESPDYYPDGRDLGENYTMTSWRMSPCGKSGQLDCMHCHTSSGRYRFAGERTNEACLPCHKDHVDSVSVHSHHQAGSGGAKCVACHMPTTEFARMRRSDHSMRPPMPAATIAFKSPNGCNSCHTDKEAAWSDGLVRQWRARDYQAPTLHVAGLVAAARKRDWSRLGEMLAYVQGKGREEVFASSLVELLRDCPDDRKWAVMIRVLKDDPSSLVRAKAAQGLGDRLSMETAGPLVEACRDPFRLVRVRAGAALAAAPDEAIPPSARKDVEAAVQEYLASQQSRPDDGFAHYNLGNYYAARGQLDKAMACYGIAHNLRPDSVLPLVNAATVLNRLGQNVGAVESLRKAAALEPGNAAVQLNLGMLLAEMGQMKEAEGSFRAAVGSDPRSAQAAYNLGILLAKDRVEEALGWLAKAHALGADEPRYGVAMAFHLNRMGQADKAIGILSGMVKRGVRHASVYALLGQVYERQGKLDAAKAVYREAADQAGFSQQERSGFAARERAISSR